MDKIRHPAFEGFNTSNKQTLYYCGIDARPLILALSGRFKEEGQVAIRRSSCKSPYCFNPTHYYWGTKSEVALETRSKNSKEISPDLIQVLRNERQKGVKILSLSRKYKLPYHVARRICNGETFSNVSSSKQEMSEEEIWYVSIGICKLLVECYPKAAKECKLAVLMSEHLTCPWHRKGSLKHKGNFGLMGECLDCMEEIKNGRCTVDVRQFDIDWYWQVKRFWDQVDVRSADECWPWRGATRRNNKESLAYFPSAFHSGKVQSAPRVAFWLSRGYTGKYRVFNKTCCETFCCNPLHITIRELKGQPIPTSIEAIHLSHDNLFQYYKQTNQQEQRGASLELPPA